MQGVARSRSQSEHSLANPFTACASCGVTIGIRRTRYICCKCQCPVCKNCVEKNPTPPAYPSNRRGSTSSLELVGTALHNSFVGNEMRGTLYWCGLCEASLSTTSTLFAPPASSKRRRNPMTALPKLSNMNGSSPAIGPTSRVGSIETMEEQNSPWLSPMSSRAPSLRATQPDEEAGAAVVCLDDSPRIHSPTTVQVAEGGVLEHAIPTTVCNNVEVTARPSLFDSIRRKLSRK